MFNINNVNIKKIKYYGLGLITSSLLFTSVAFATEPIKIILDGKELQNTNVLVINDSTYLPVRKLCESLGLKVNFDEVNKSVIIESSDEQYQQPSNSNIEKQQINNIQQSNIEILKDYPITLYKYPIKYNNNIYLTLTDGCKIYNIDKNTIKYNTDKKEILFKNTNMLIKTTDIEYCIFYNGINYIKENVFKINQL